MSDQDLSGETMICSLGRIKVVTEGLDSRSVLSPWVGEHPVGCQVNRIADAQNLGLAHTKLYGFAAVCICLCNDRSAVDFNEP